MTGIYNHLKSPKISVIITSYNRANFIKIAIESVLNSSFDDFELIISDDCSKDNSHSIALDFAGKDERIKVFRNEKNIGDYPNRILSISRSNGKWIKFVDCDDYISKTCLEEMYSFAENSQLHFGICAPRINDFIVLNTKEAFDSGYLNYFGPTGSFFLKEKYLELGGFVNRITVSDWHMWQRFAMNGSIMIFPERLATWRDHIDNTLKSDSHKYGVIQYLLKSKYEILSNKCHPDSAKHRLSSFRSEVFITFKMSVKFSIRAKTIKPILNLIKYNYLYLFIVKFPESQENK